MPGHGTGPFAPLSPFTSGGGAGVRGVQLADHFIDDIHELVAVGHIGDQGFVLGAHRIPVGAVQLGIVEPIYLRLIQRQASSNISSHSCGLSIRTVTLNVILLGAHRHRLRRWVQPPPLPVGLGAPGVGTPPAMAAIMPPAPPPPPPVRHRRPAW